MSMRNIKSYIAVVAAATALGLGVAAPASASDGSVRALHIASGASGEGVLGALATRSGGEVISVDLHGEAHRRVTLPLNIVSHRDLRPHGLSTATNLTF
jgi:hypothetical protein